MGIITARQNMKGQIAQNKILVEQGIQQAKQMKDQAYATQLERMAVEANAKAREEASELEEQAVEGLMDKAQVIQGVSKESYADQQVRRDSFFNTRKKYSPSVTKRVKAIMK